MRCRVGVPDSIGTTRIRLKQGDHQHLSSLRDYATVCGIVLGLGLASEAKTCHRFAIKTRNKTRATRYHCDTNFLATQPSGFASPDGLRRSAKQCSFRLQLRRHFLRSSQRAKGVAAEQFVDVGRRVASIQQFLSNQGICRYVFKLCRQSWHSVEV